MRSVLRGGHDTLSDVEVAKRAYFRAIGHREIALDLLRVSHDERTDADDALAALRSDPAGLGRVHLADRRIDIEARSVTDYAEPPPDESEWDDPPVEEWEGLLGASADNIASVNGNGDAAKGAASDEDAFDPFHIIDWSTFWTEDDDEDRSLIEPVIPRGRGGAVRGGEGRQVRPRAVDGAATGDGFDLHGKKVEPVDVLLLDFEMTIADVRDRLEDFGIDPDADLSHLHLRVTPDHSRPRHSRRRSGGSRQGGRGRGRPRRGGQHHRTRRHRSRADSTPTPSAPSTRTPGLRLKAAGHWVRPPRPRR